MNKISSRKLSLNADDPFLNFIGYSQKAADDDFQNNNIVESTPNTRQVKIDALKSQIKRQSPELTKAMSSYASSKMTDDQFYSRVRQLLHEEEITTFDKRSRSLGRGESTDYSWRTDEYWQFPDNVRKAIDVANLKTKHS